jgi:hypothetical protein
MPVTSYKAGGTFGGNCQNPSNAAASDDVKTSHNNGNTLIVTNFDFGLPAGATIDGVECRVESSVNNSGTWTQVVDLYDGAAIGTSKSTTGITSLTDEVRSYGGASDVWSATLTQAIINGSGFGVRVTANRTTGIGSARFEVDFVEARVHYTEAAPPSELVGSSSGVATIAGVLSGIGSMIATAAGIATTAGVLSAIGKLVGSSSGIASASGTLEESSAPSLDRVRYTQHRDGQSGRLYGSFDRTPSGEISGSSEGVATATGTLTIPAVVDRARYTQHRDGQSGQLYGSFQRVAAEGIVGSAAGVATVTGTATGIGSLVGSSEGVATATGTITSDTSLSGTASGAATVTGTLTGIGSISGSAAGVATVNGAIGSGLSGSTTGTATVTGTLTATGTLAGSVSGAATATGTLFGSGRLIAAVTGTATTSGTLTGIGTLAGSVSGQATVTGRVSGGTSGMIIQYYYHLAT